MTALAFLGTHWRTLLSLATIAALTVALLIAKSDTSHWRKIADNREKQIAAMTLEASKQRADNEAKLAAAATAYAERNAALEPVIVHSRGIVREYAKTPSGSAACLPADRLRGIDDLDRAIANIGTAGSGADPVRTDASPAAERR